MTASKKSAWILGESGKTSRRRRVRSQQTPQRARDSSLRQWLAVPSDRANGSADATSGFQGSPGRSGKRRSRRKPARGRRASSPRARVRRLNEMTFEEFRAAGLSINQSARLIAAREARGRFRSLDELDQVSNVARATIAELKQRLAFPDRTT